MSTFIVIIIFGLLMSIIALVGAFTIIIPEHWFKKIVKPLVSLAAGTLIGGAIFHLLPTALSKTGISNLALASFSLGFVVLFMLEQFLDWHHCHLSPLQHKPVSYLILVADGIHNFIGGITVGAAFMIDIKLGIITWIVAAFHEVPQELGDFGILIHSGWGKKEALFYNLLSGLTFPVGAVIAYLLSRDLNLAYIIAFASGNFLYIGASDLIPQLKAKHTRDQIIQFSILILGLLVMYLIKVIH